MASVWAFEDVSIRCDLQSKNSCFIRKQNINKEKLTCSIF